MSAAVAATVLDLQQPDISPSLVLELDAYPDQPRLPVARDTCWGHCSCTEDERPTSVMRGMVLVHGVGFDYNARTLLGLLTPARWGRNIFSPTGYGVSPAELQARALRCCAASCCSKKASFFLAQCIVRLVEILTTLPFHTDTHKANLSPQRCPLCCLRPRSSAAVSRFALGGAGCWVWMSWKSRGTVDFTPLRRSLLKTPVRQFADFAARGRHTEVVASEGSEAPAR